MEEGILYKHNAHGLAHTQTYASFDKVFLFQHKFYGSVSSDNICVKYQVIYRECAILTSKNKHEGNGELHIQKSHYPAITC